MDVKTEALPHTIRRRTRNRFLSILLALIVIYGILWFVSIEKRAQQARAKSKEQWTSLMETHPYIPARDTDLRSPCPALNTLANHGFLPRDGRHITPEVLFDAVVKLGVTPIGLYSVISMVYFQLRNAHPNDSFLSQFQFLPEIDLDHLTAYRIVEHDVSLTRNDTAVIASTSQKEPAYIERMIQIAQNGQFTRKNEQDIRKIRWLESIRDNKLLHYGLFDQMASAAECSLLLDVLGRNGNISVPHLYSFLMEERIPDDWFPQDKSLISFYPSMFRCWYGVRHSKASL